MKALKISLITLVIAFSVQFAKAQSVSVGVGFGYDQPYRPYRNVVVVRHRPVYGYRPDYVYYNRPRYVYPRYYRRPYYGTYYRPYYRRHVYAERAYYRTDW